VSADEVEGQRKESLSLEDRVRGLETEVRELRRRTNRANWLLEALLVIILLMGATAWYLWRG
jgi:hypothetical protein